jgi:hypothetical protein
LVFVLGACAYRPGSFELADEPFVRARVSVACLDVAIERRPDLDDGSKVLGYAFGNRCDRPAVVDLLAASIVGRTRDGGSVALAAVDPARELRPLRLDGGASGREAIAYTSSIDVVTVCVDVATIAHAGAPSWVCVDR